MLTIEKIETDSFGTKTITLSEDDTDYGGDNTFCIYAEEGDHESLQDKLRELGVIR